jgi:ParB-like chromosome segregation protein Spo0J
LSCILNNSWTVRQAEQFVISAKKDPSAIKARGSTESENELTKQLSGQLGTPVKIKHTAKGGQLIIRFDSEDELKRLIGIIQNR